MKLASFVSCAKKYGVWDLLWFKYGFGALILDI
ncbi:MAG: hypothetical protein ACJAS6_000623 [Rickettsiales bacterium]|jgi:hypothetical protein